MPTTPSAVSLSFVSRSAVLLALSVPRAAFAQAEEPDQGVPSPELKPQPAAAQSRSPEPSELPPITESTPKPPVQITSVGLAAASLEWMLGPTLRSAFRLRFTSTDHFEPEELFLDPSDSAPGIRVWVDTRTPRLARIYISNKDGTRYLLRDLQCSKPLGEMDREAIAQTIEWSLGALSEGTAGMTRAEAEALLAEPEADQSAPPNSDRPPPQLRKWRRHVDAWLPEVALLHRLSPHSKELLGAQGPVLRVGVDHVSARHQLGLATSLLYQFPQRHTDGGVALELETAGARLGGRYLALGLAPGFGWGLHLGFGFDAAFASPEVLDRARFEAAENTANIVPLIDTGLTFQARVEPGVRLEVNAGAEFDLVEVHYEVLTEVGPSSLLTRWPVRPTISVGVALF